MEEFATQRTFGRKRYCDQCVMRFGCCTETHQPPFWYFTNEATCVQEGILFLFDFYPTPIAWLFAFWKPMHTKSWCSADVQSYCFLIQFSRPWNSSNNGTSIPQFSARRYKHYRIQNRSSQQWNHIIKSLSMREGAYENGQMIRCLHLLWAHQHLVEIFFQICCKVSLRLESTIWGRMISPLAISSWNCH